MKKEQREIYQILANEVSFDLCGFCKYAERTGSCCETDCAHPLVSKGSFDSEIESAVNLGDCWGFRPDYPVEFVADVVGAVLSHGWDEAYWWQNKKGIWKIAGRVGL